MKYRLSLLCLTDVSFLCEAGRSTYQETVLTRRVFPANKRYGRVEAIVSERRIIRLRRQWEAAGRIRRETVVEKGGVVFS